MKKSQFGFSARLLKAGALAVLGLSLGFAVATASRTESNPAALPFYESSDFGPLWLRKDGSRARRLHTIPHFELTNQLGETVTEQDVAERVYVASFFFTTCPGICPALTENLRQVQDRFLGDDSVRILSHSIRPTTDTVAVLLAYSEKHHIEPEMWHLLTGDKNDIYALAKDAYFANEDLGNPQANEDFLHTESFLLIDQNRQIRGIYNGLSSSAVEHLISDIEMLLGDR